VLIPPHHPTDVTVRRRATVGDVGYLNHFDAGPDASVAEVQTEPAAAAPIADEPEPKQVNADAVAQRVNVGSASHRLRTVETACAIGTPEHHSACMSETNSAHTRSATV